MTAAYIVAEYNPLHNGHLHHISRTREALNPDAVVCVMSGAFTQRGSAAVADKWARAEMALRAGADLILELHPVYACSSAERFALGAIRTVKAFGAPGWLSFGAENDDLGLLGAIADVLLAEPEAYRRALAEGLGAGHSFARARAGALARYLRSHGAEAGKGGASGAEDAGGAQGAGGAWGEGAGDAAGAWSAGSARGAGGAGGASYAGAKLDAILKAPNNILAIEYLKAIKIVRPPVRPFAVRRLDTPGAQSIRDMLRRFVSEWRAEVPGASIAWRAEVPRAPIASGASGAMESTGATESTGAAGFSNSPGEARCAAGNHGARLHAGLPREIAALMPDFAAGILEALIADGAGPIFDGDYFIQLLSAIRRMPPGRLAAYGDVGEGLENRIARAARSYSGYESLIEAISTKRYPKTRIRRILARILLGFDNGALAGLGLDSGPPYIRALGFSPAGQALLAQAARQRGSAAPAAAAVPVVTKFAHLKRSADPRQRAFMELDARATDIYATAFAGNPRRMEAGQDYTRGAIRAH